MEPKGSHSEGGSSGSTCDSSSNPARSRKKGRPSTGGQDTGCSEERESGHAGCQRHRGESSKKGMGGVGGRRAIFGAAHNDLWVICQRIKQVTGVGRKKYFNVLPL